MFVLLLSFLVGTSWDQENSKESKEPDNDEDKDQLEVEKEGETGELKEETTDQVF
jgi:hypothetical protein